MYLIKMTTYTRSLSGDFGGNLSAGHFHEEVNADVGIIPGVVTINAKDDVVDIVFDTSLSVGEEAILDGLISSHVIHVEEPPYKIISGASDPTTEGNDGELYINTATKTLFGPKVSGSWPAGVSMIGADGVSAPTPYYEINEVNDGEDDLSTNSKEYIIAQEIVNPPAGTYDVFWSVSVHNTKKKKQVQTSLFKNDTAIGTSKKYKQNEDQIGSLTTLTVVTVNGSETISGRWKVDHDTGEMFSRVLKITMH